MRANDMTNKKVLRLIGLSILISLTVLWSSSEAAQVVRYSVGRVGGTIYVIGSGMSEIVKKYIPGYTLELTTASGGSEGLRLVDSKQVEMATVPPTTLLEAIEGKGDFAKEKKYTDLRHILNMNPGVWSPIVLKGSSIKTFSDIKGKMVAIPSSGHLQMFKDYLKAYGMKIEDLRWQYLDYTKAADALADRKVDMIFFHTGLPVSSADELAHRVDIRILPLDNYAAEKLVKDNPTYSKGVLPAGTYKGVDKDIPAGKNFGPVVCHKDLDANFVYQFCKQVFFHLDYLKTVHPAAKRMNVEDAIEGRVVPFHPGAEKYYKEIKLIK